MPSSADKHGLWYKPDIDTFVVITDPNHPYFNQLAFVQGGGQNGDTKILKLVFKNRHYIEYPDDQDTLIRVNTYETMAYLRDLRTLIGEVETSYYKGDMKNVFYRLSDAENEIKDLRTLLEMDVAYWNIQKNTRTEFEPRSLIGLHSHPFEQPNRTFLKTLEEVEAMKLKKR